MINSTKLLTKILIIVIAFLVFYIAAAKFSFANVLEVGTDRQFKNITDALNSASNNDIILVYPGDYDEKVNIRIEGINLISKEKYSAQIKKGVNIYAKGAVIDGFFITNDQGGWQEAGVWIEADNAVVKNNKITKVPSTAIAASWQGTGMWNNIQITNNTISESNKGITISGKNWIVENNDLSRLIYYGDDADYVRFFGSDIVIQNNYMHDTLEVNIGPSHTDIFQTFENNGKSAQNITIRKNFATGFFHEGLMITGKSDSHKDIYVEENVFWGGQSWGICAIGIKNLVVRNNIFKISLHGTGFQKNKDYPTTGIIENNIFVDSDSAYWHDDISNYVSRHNVWLNVRNSPDSTASSDIFNPVQLFTNTDNIIGNDNIPFTSDDGLNFNPSSPIFYLQKSGIKIGPYWDSIGDENTNNTIINSSNNNSENINSSSNNSISENSSSQNKSNPSQNSSDIIINNSRNINSASSGPYHHLRPDAKNKSEQDGLDTWGNYNDTENSFEKDQSNIAFDESANTPYNNNNIDNTNGNYFTEFAYSFTIFAIIVSIILVCIAIVKTIKKYK